MVYSIVYRYDSDSGEEYNYDSCDLEDNNNLDLESDSDGEIDLAWEISAISSSNVPARIDDKTVERRKGSIATKQLILTGKC